MALPLYGYNPYQFGQVNPLQPQMDRLANMQAQSVTEPEAHILHW